MNRNRQVKVVTPLEPTTWLPTIVKVEEGGRILLPKALVEALDLNRGDILELKIRRLKKCI